MSHPPRKTASTALIALMGLIEAVFRGVSRGRLTLDPRRAIPHPGKSLMEKLLNPEPLPSGSKNCYPREGNNQVSPGWIVTICRK